MSRKNESNQKAALRSAFGQFLRENDVTIKNSDDVNSIMKDMISLVLEGALDGEMDEHLGYSSMIMKVRILETAGMDILRKLFTPAMEIPRLMYQETVRVNLNLRYFQSILQFYPMTLKLRFYLCMEKV